MLDKSRAGSWAGCSCLVHANFGIPSASWGRPLKLANNKGCSVGRQAGSIEGCDHTIWASKSPWSWSLLSSPVDTATVHISWLLGSELLSGLLASSLAHFVPFSICTYVISSNCFLIHLFLHLLAFIKLCASVALWLINYSSIGYLHCFNLSLLFERGI